MSFTQEQQLNINGCMGCGKRCKFGFTTEEFTTLHDGISVKHEVFYPTLAGVAIKSYLDRFGKLKHTGTDVVDGKLATGQEFTAQWRQVIQDAQQAQAYEIAKLCDHYKTR